MKLLDFFYSRNSCAKYLNSKTFFKKKILITKLSYNGNTLNFQFKNTGSIPVSLILYLLPYIYL